ncbi:hypothetical protein Pmani_030708 [Petrolisthes manimaculis]|uniref:Uncharacterized protein n=1 Tax=Petrolisthes manimaculis TaxID=1843537 RepID=A0AAE1NXA2_9EUCA|nr:hypothetical protein Pmani_030708 [Petrolisthes manimaculis]
MHGHTETLWVRVTIPCHPSNTASIIVCVVYHPPRATTAQLFTDHIIDTDDRHSEDYNPLQANLDRLQTWTEHNNVSINHTKTLVMHICTSSAVVPSSTPSHPLLQVSQLTAIYEQALSKFREGLLHNLVPPDAPTPARVTRHQNKLVPLRAPHTDCYHQSAIPSLVRKIYT